MNTLPDPSSAAASSALYSDPRRIYFKHLTASLLAEGLDGATIGQLVAELDQHVTMSNTLPVDELGPVNELAPALVEAVGGGDRWVWNALQIAFAVTFGLAGAALQSLMLSKPGHGRVTIDLMLVGLTIVLALMGIRMYRKGSRSIIGRSSWERPSIRPALPFLAAIVATSFLIDAVHWSPYLDRQVSRGFAWLLLAVSTLATVAVYGLIARRQRIPIPGNARHLRRLRGPLPS